MSETEDKKFTHDIPSIVDEAEALLKVKDGDKVVDIQVPQSTDIVLPYAGRELGHVAREANDILSRLKSSLPTAVHLDTEQKRSVLDDINAQYNFSFVRYLSGFRVEHIISMLRLLADETADVQQKYPGLEEARAFFTDENVRKAMLKSAELRKGHMELVLEPGRMGDSYKRPLTEAEAVEYYRSEIAKCDRIIELLTAQESQADDLDPSTDTVIS